MKTKRVMVLDTETSGLTGHVVQLAYVILSDGKIVSEYNKYWRLDQSQRMDSRAVAVHGIRTDWLRMHGVCPRAELESFCCVLGEVDVIVAHNMSFDERRLRDTASFYGIALPVFRNSVCTMKGAKMWCGFKDKLGRLKAPRNVELYEKLHKKMYDGASLHDALADVRMTASNYVLGCGVGLW